MERQEAHGCRGLEGLKKATGLNRQLLRAGGKETRRVPIEGEERVS